MIKTYYLARILRRLHIPSFRHCHIDKTAKVASGAALTKVSMGRYSYVGSYTHITDAEIGSFCSIGGNCGIGGGIHPLDKVSTSPAFLKGRNILGRNFAKISYEPSKKVVIGNDVWIGECVYVMPGVTIGDGAVIGTHAVVTSDVEPFSIVAGVPAKVLRKRFDDETIGKLTELQWWNWSEEKLSEMGQYFNSPQELIQAAER